MGSAFEDATFKYRPGKLSQGWEAAAREAFHEYGHRYDAGTVYHGGYVALDEPRLRLPSRMTTAQFTWLGSHLMDFREHGYWIEYKPTSSITESNRIKHRTTPLTPAQQKNRDTMRALEAYINTLMGNKYDREVFVARLNPQQEKEWKERWGLKGTTYRVAYAASWVPI